LCATGSASVFSAFGKSTGGASGTHVGVDFPIAPERMMFLKSPKLLFVVRFVVLAGLFCGDAFAQTSPRRNPKSTKQTGGTAKQPGKTTVTVEILMGADGLGLRAQELRPLFENLGVSLRIRQGTARDKVETRETNYGKLRDVLVVGRLDEKGRLVFAERSFATSEAAKIGEWLRELETYGALGAPEGKPLWGLTEAQFKDIHSQLAEKVENDTAELSLDEAIKQLSLPAKYPVRVSTNAEKWLEETFPAMPPVRHRLKDCSKGTALALITNEYGLGYRPLRTPEGSIELVIDPLTKTTDVWPIGWQIKVRPAEAAPKLFELKSYEVPDRKLADVFEMVTAETGIPVRVDDFTIKTQGINLDEIRVTQPRRQTPLSLLLLRATNPHHLNSEVRLDEAGQPFVWISLLLPGGPAK